MTEQLTRKIEQGEIPANPSVEDILGKLGMKSGWDSLRDLGLPQDVVLITAEDLHEGRWRDKLNAARAVWYSRTI